MVYRQDICFFMVISQIRSPIWLFSTFIEIFIVRVEEGWMSKRGEQADRHAMV